jgi:hypothetical protein
MSETDEIGCGEFRNYRRTENESESETGEVRCESESELGRKNLLFCCIPYMIYTKKKGKHRRNATTQKWNSNIKEKKGK